MKHRGKIVAGLAAVALTVTATPALAADSEQGYRWPSAYSSNPTEKRPAVAWQAIGHSILVTPPGYSGTPSDPLVYTSPNRLVYGLDGDLMKGGKWVVYSIDNVIQANTYGACI